ncbi:MAG TPA: serine--tRNA ligase [Acidimicrobiales bacterium]|nr:serine--tRNA ligase [Acidimicrobiales bacterium]
MIDVRLLRHELDATKAALARKGVVGADVDRAADLDARQRAAQSAVDGLRREVKELSTRVGLARRQGRSQEAEDLSHASRGKGEELAQKEAESATIAAALRDLLLVIPNPPAPDAPDGASEADNVVVRSAGERPYEAHQRVPHWDVGAALGILDLERGAKISGSMFPAFRGAGATLARALCQLALDRNADAYEEIRPPTLVRPATLEASGQLPKFADDAYHIERDDLWAIPTAEVPLTSLYRDEVLDEAAMPVRLMAATPCYRREAGSAGRDTRGLLRVHEFDKVEILALCTRDQAAAMHAELLGRAEGTVAALGLPYRIVDLCAGDLGQSHARCFDIEVYAPGCDLWLEVSSVSWFGDYQARRAGIRYRPAPRPAGAGDAAKRPARANRVCDTLNGSALAVPRVWAALVETYRQADGSVSLPPVLHPYMRGQTVLRAGRVSGLSGG